jgi:uncharacterized integral membrane protein
MNPYRGEGLGWLSWILAALGAVIVAVNLLDVDFWLFGVLAAVPLVFGLILLAVGGVLILAGLFFGQESDA